MDHKGLIARAIIPIAIAITVISVSAPTTPAAATEPAPAEPTPTQPVVTEPVVTEPVVTEPAVIEPAPVATTTTVVATSTRHHRRRPIAAKRLIRVARRQLGDRYVYGAAGPRRFDCSGLVLYSLRHSHSRRIASLGGRSADSFYAAYRRHHRVGRHGHPGDLVIWGGGRHIGIYLGQGRAISALTRRGVSVHGLHAVTMPFNGFLHTRLWRHR